MPKPKVYTAADFARWGSQGGSKTSKAKTAGAKKAAQISAMNRFGQAALRLLRIKVHRLRRLERRARQLQAEIMRDEINRRGQAWLLTRAEKRKIAAGLNRVMP